ncbi:hypothetical protein ACP70R_027844 [Stipagrostis hirtigluma subsp. patula]
MPTDSVVIRLPDPRALRVVARSVLLAVALLSMPWLRAAEAPARRRAADACGAAAAQAELLLRDLRREGLLVPGARAVVIGADGNCDAAALQPLQDEDNAMRPISLQRMLMMGDSSVDFLLDFGYFDDEADRFGFADRVLKSGGILAAPVGSLSVFSLPQNYRVTYIHQFAEIFVGIKKTAHAAGDIGNDGTRMELASAAVAELKEGMVSSHPAKSDKAQLKNTGRKLLLSEITRAPGGRHQDLS